MLDKAFKEILKIKFNSVNLCVCLTFVVVVVVTVVVNDYPDQIFQVLPKEGHHWHIRLIFCQKWLKGS